MLDFSHKRNKTKSFSRLQNKFVKPTEERYILSLICEIVIGSKLDFKKLMIYQ